MNEMGAKPAAKPIVQTKPGVAPKPASTTMEDRDLLEWPAFQELYRRIAAGCPPVGTFQDRNGRPFDVVAGLRPLDPPIDDAERDAQALGYDTLMMIGAIARDDGRCHASLGLFLADTMPTVREKSLEVDVNHRRLRIGAGLFATALQGVRERLGKTLVLSNVFSPAGERFAQWARGAGIL